MHDYYDHRFHVSHPTSVELYKLSNHTQVSIKQKNIIAYVFIGLVGLCLSIKCLQIFLSFCCRICEYRESNMLTNGTEVEEDSNEVNESYEPPGELQQSQRDRPNIESTVQENEESENSEDLPSYYDVCVKTEN